MKNPTFARELICAEERVSFWFPFFAESRACVSSITVSNSELSTVLQRPPNAKWPSLSGYSDLREGNQVGMINRPEVLAHHGT